MTAVRCSVSLALVRPRRLDSELDGEVRGPPGAGRTRRAGRRDCRRRKRAASARRDFGSIERIKEEHRDRRSVRWIDTLVKDLRYGLTLLGRDPVFAFVAISVMAIGIGANTAMFSIVDAVAAEAAALSRARAHRPRLGSADARRRATASARSTSSIGSA